jgi:polyferredoxin
MRGMACFIAPAAVAIITTVAQRIVKNKEQTAGGGHTEKTTGRWTQRLRWLNTMLWGGVVLLALEHVWHGELVPWPPFLTAMQTPGGVGPMLYEIAVYGGIMTVVILVAWGILVGIAELAERKAKSVDLPEIAASKVGGGA